MYGVEAQKNSIESWNLLSFVLPEDDDDEKEKKSNKVKNESPTCFDIWYGSFFISSKQLISLLKRISEAKNLKNSTWLWSCRLVYCFSLSSCVSVFLDSRLLRTKPRRKPMPAKSISLFRSTRSSSVAIVFLLADFGIRCLSPITSSFVSLSSVVREMKRNWDACYCAAGLKAMMKAKQAFFFVFFNYNRTKSAREKPQGSRTLHFSDVLEYLSFSIQGQSDHRRHFRTRPVISWNLAMNSILVLSRRYWSDWHRHVSCEGRKNDDDWQISTDKLFWHYACRSLDKGGKRRRRRSDET